MPIVVDSEVVVFTKDEFHTLAERVIGIVFGVHNDFGRLMNEDIYKQIIRRRCEAAGIDPVRREVEITVSYHDFQKSFYMDLFLAHGLMVETKTVEQLTSAHEAQALHYLLLSGMRHGLLMNLRPGKVEKRFVSTSLDLAERRRVRVQDAEWNPVNEPSRRMREILVELLNDWGANQSGRNNESFWSFCPPHSSSLIPRVRVLRSSHCGIRISSLPRRGSAGRAALHRRTWDRCILKPSRR